MLAIRILLLLIIGIIYSSDASFHRDARRHERRHGEPLVHVPGTRAYRRLMRGRNRMYPAPITLPVPHQILARPPVPFMVAPHSAPLQPPVPMVDDLASSLPSEGSIMEPHPPAVLLAKTEGLYQPDGFSAVVISPPEHPPLLMPDQLNKLIIHTAEPAPVEGTQDINSFRRPLNLPVPAPLTIVLPPISLPIPPPHAPLPEAVPPQVPPPFQLPQTELVPGLPTPFRVPYPPISPTVPAPPPPNPQPEAPFLEPLPPQVPLPFQFPQTELVPGLPTPFRVPYPPISPTVPAPPPPDPQPLDPFPPQPHPELPPPAPYPPEPPFVPAPPMPPPSDPFPPQPPPELHPLTPDLLPSVPSEQLPPVPADLSPPQVPVPLPVPGSIFYALPVPLPNSLYQRPILGSFPGSQYPIFISPPQQAVPYPPGTPMAFNFPAFYPLQPNYVHPGGTQTAPPAPGGIQTAPPAQVPYRAPPPLPHQPLNPVHYPPSISLPYPPLRTPLSGLPYPFPQPPPPSLPYPPMATFPLPPFPPAPFSNTPAAPLPLPPTAPLPVQPAPSLPGSPHPAPLPLPPPPAPSPEPPVVPVPPPPDPLPDPVQPARPSGVNIPISFGRARRLNVPHPLPNPPHRPIKYEEDWPGPMPVQQGAQGDGAEGNYLPSYSPLPAPFEEFGTGQNVPESSRVVEIPVRAVPVRIWKVTLPGDKTDVIG